VFPGFSPRFWRFFCVLSFPLLLAAQRNEYVDARLCASCHPQIAATYARTGMGRSFSLPTLKDVTSRPYFHQPSSTWFAMLQRDGKFYQRRWRTTPDGREADVQELQIDYVMGSGNHVRSYLHRTARGTLAELPLAWYAENGGTWAMSPGQDRTYLQPARAIAYECIFCHNSYPRIAAGHEEPGSEPVYVGALPEGIDCQRCHGPGGNHVHAAQPAGSTAAAVRAAIVNPARLSGERQMEVCMQCHLETVSMQLPHSIVRYGRGPFSYRPGEPLGSFEIFFDRAPAKRPDNIEIVNSVYRLRQSRCFLQSAGKMTCTTCHNPHDIPRGEAASLHYNAVCGSCHAGVAKHAASPDCVGCHMPKRRTVDVVHAVMTDHRIQRRPPPGDLLAPIAEQSDVDENRYRGEVVPYYPSPLPQTAENALYVSVAQVTQRSNLEKGLPKLAAEIERQKPARPEFYIELGQAWLGVRQPGKAIAAFSEAARREPQSSIASLNLADAMSEAGQSERALGVLRQALEKAPDDPLLWYQLGIACRSADRETDAIAAFEKASRLDPEFAEAHNLLGAALAAAGELDRAQWELTEALRINPDEPSALGNLGHLLAARGDLAGAAARFARSVELRPNEADVLTNYAVTLAALNRMEEAQRQIDAAVKADPSSADAHNFRGTLLERQGKGADALREFLEAIRLRPDFDRAHLNAGRLLAAKGDRAGAAAHFTAAGKSPDPRIQRQAADELRKLKQ
jgi:Flp pilus assembly protein TadD